MGNVRTVERATTGLSDSGETTHETTRSRLSWRRPLMIAGVVAVIAACLVLWVRGGRFVTIDNATIESDKLSLSTDVAGQVTEVPVREGQAVRAGEVMFRIDDRQYRIGAKAARANLAQTRLQLLAMEQDYVRMLRDVDEKKAEVAMDQARFVRAAGLVGAGDLSRQNFDDSRFKLMADQQAERSAEATATVQLAKLGGKPDADVATLPNYELGAAELSEVERRLTDTVVRAPMDGVVTGVAQLRPGTYLAAGMPGFGLVAQTGQWVEAHPKETALTWVRDGQPARISVDAYPGRVWDGTVESVAPASGSEFSILPAENSSGNWVKVVQRIPLRVRVVQHAGDPVLRAGMSVVVTIDTGHVRHWSDLL